MSPIHHPPPGGSHGPTASTPLLLHQPTAAAAAADDDTTSTLGPASTRSSSSSSSLRSTSSHRTSSRRRAAAQRTARNLSFLSALLSSLCAGSVTVFSMYGHIFQERLHYSQFQVNGVASAASVAMYIPVSLLGYVCDRVGPAPLSLLSAVFFGGGYALAAGLYRQATVTAAGGAGGMGRHHGGGGDTEGIPGGAWAYAGMITAFVFIGIGTCSMYLSAVATCAKNFGRGKHRGLALAVPIAAFGLSGMWQSQLGSRVFCERRADGSKGDDVDVFRFFIFLAVLLFVVGLLGTFGLRIVDEQDLIDDAVEELERSGFLDGSALFSPVRSVSGGVYGAIVEPAEPIDEEDAGILAPSKDADEEEEEARIKKQWVLNAETRRFLTDPTMWCFALGFFCMIGPGEAFINNLGTVIKTLRPPTLHYFGPPTSAATHVSIVGITSTIVRLITGSLTDLLAPSPQAQHVQITSSTPMLQRMRFSVSRVTFLLFFAGVLSLGLATLASGLMQFHDERFWIVSGLVGAGYGAVFSLTPIIITVIWGVENFATNWGIVAMFPALGATVWGLIYSAVYQAGANKKLASPGGSEDDSPFCYGVDSIVSKRSVEKLYYPNEPHFFRFFVKKFQRRAPLINRGYHLRLHAIDVLVRNFLLKDHNEARKQEEKKKVKKVVVNLGCGSDVLPWQCLTRYPDGCKDAVFVDVDFPDLIERKRQTVVGTPELLGAFTGVATAATEELPPNVVFRSDQYVQVGCDLRQLGTLRAALVSVLGDLSECVFLFVAEVSITYMETEGADGVVEWAAGLGDSEFVLLEQILPAGPKHPFADTMLNHFHKLNTQLKSVEKYSTVESQLQRFTSRGWKTVDVWTLWQAWTDDTFLSAADRRKLEEVEPFDEWEEFALFASHYCIVHARTASEDGSTEEEDGSTEAQEIPTQAVTLQFDELPGQRGQRRFAAAMKTLDRAAAIAALDRGNETSITAVVNVMGLGTKARLQSCDVYSQGKDSTGLSSEAEGSAFTLLEGGPTTRMCHALTDLGNGGRCLLSGGRASPSAPFKDCWLFDKSTNGWERTHDLPTPLYRHSVTRLGNSDMVLLIGGRGQVDIFDGYLVYQPQVGWVSCEIVGSRPTPVYGAILACEEGDVNFSGHTFSGIFFGGLNNEGVIPDPKLCWNLDLSNPKVRFVLFPQMGIHFLGGKTRELLSRFGATCVPLKSGEFVIFGGVTGDHLLDQQDEFLVCSVGGWVCRITRRLVDQDLLGGGRYPLLVGTSAVSMPDGRVVIIGGGATCFSMGTFWNKAVYTLHVPSTGMTAVNGLISSDSHWSHVKTLEIVSGGREVSQPVGLEAGSQKVEIKPILRTKLESQEDFARLLHEGKPAILEGLDLGSCVADWNLKYLVEKVGKDRKVVIHESATQAMDFNAKNFRYVTTEFGDFTERVEKGDKLYLRALSSEKPSEQPAMLTDDFPLLAPDFVLPPQLSQVEENLFSSVLRVSGPVNMWLHYDVMANVYCQISGSKRLMLFPPGDVEHLGFAAGASSSSIDVFASLDSNSAVGQQLARTHPHEAVLSPGGVLFLPPLWLHTATPTSDSSIAVNVFFRDLVDGVGYAAGRDVYGNRDLAAYEKGRQDIGRIANSFQKLPAEAREFYLLRLADELRRKARS
ncbi:hypothetical protein B0T17DRAFT_586727 [Bombardia bombarda]|uniref:tRNA wybutosine-synthesizing protein 4 n=1 Tax=Bombardia bombarda TaxID=252184 RepID=A0AA39XJD8_9PEZI|nr:hypothetical protein B0T17DRAFT_586727 [Bombardia bombarda]